jgi:predicted amidohydrolase YtcJ
LLLRDARLPHPGEGADELVDVLVSDGRIVAVGAAAMGDVASDAVRDDAAAAGEEVVDLDGRWLVPGLWDEHTHFSQWSLVTSRLDVSAAASARETATLVGAALADETSDAAGSVARSSDTFVGVGFRDGLWPDAPNLADLDAVSGERPVALTSADLHCVWLNSAALARYGFAGHPTGLLREGDAFRIEHAINDIDAATLDRLADAAARRAAARGVVGVVDLEMEWNLENWERRMAAGFDRLRVEFGIYRHHLDRAVEMGLRSGDARSALLTVGRFKILIDGSLNTRTAYCFEPFPSGGHGVLTVPFDELVPLMRTASAAGIESTVHAIGDHAVAVALDAFAEVGCRGRLEHAQLIAPADLPRFAALGVTASLQPEHAMDDRDVADHFWAGRQSRVIPARALLDAGAHIVLGSDAPVAPIDPWGTMGAAVTRTRDGREPWHPEQAISPTEALAASTRSTIAAGQPADLVVVEDNPLDPAALRAMPVAATLLGGRFTHRRL